MAKLPANGLQHLPGNIGIITKYKDINNSFLPQSLQKEYANNTET